MAALSHVEVVVCKRPVHKVRIVAPASSYRSHPRSTVTITTTSRYTAPRAHPLLLLLLLPPCKDSNTLQGQSLHSTVWRCVRRRVVYTPHSEHIHSLH